MGRQAKKADQRSAEKGRQKYQVDDFEEQSIAGTLMSEDGEIEQDDALQSHLNDFLEALQDKKVKNKSFFIGQTLRLLQKHYISEDATSYIADVVTQQSKKQCIESIVKIVTLVFLQNPDEELLQYLSRIDTAASLRAQILVKFILDDQPTQDDIQALLQCLRAHTSAQNVLHALEALALIVSDGGVTLLSEDQQDRLQSFLCDQVQSQDSSIRYLAAKLSACLNQTEGLPDSDFLDFEEESLRSSLTVMSIENAMEQNIRPTDRSVKRVHKKDRALDKSQAQYLHLMRGQGYQAKEIVMQHGKDVSTYQIDSLQQQVVDETLRWILEAGINVHVYENPVVQSVLNVEITQKGGKLSQQERQQQKKVRQRNVGYVRTMKPGIMDY